MITAGFTLLELLVGIVIIGLLVGYVAPRYFSQVGKSEVQVGKAQIDGLEKALDQYRLDTRRYPGARRRAGALRRPVGALGARARLLARLPARAAAREALSGHALLHRADVAARSGLEPRGGAADARREGARGRAPGGPRRDTRRDPPRRA